MIPTLFHASILIFGTMTIFFIVSIFKKDNSVTDVAWPIGFMQIALYLLSQHKNPGNLQYICCILVFVWGLRLAAHLAERNTVIGEDPRYRQWRALWSSYGACYFFTRSFIQIFMLHGFFLLIVSLPILAIQIDQAQTTLGIIGLVGLIIWIIGFIFETVADYQLARFKRNHNSYALMTSGLWKYSRHPNYFGESLIWWGFWILSIETTHGLISVASPITITILLLYISGIPLTEKLLQHSPAFTNYKQQTSAFLPLPPFKD